MVLTSPASRAVRWQAGDDVLSSVLRSLRPRGHVFCRAELSAPWGLEFVAREFAHFHVVEEGSAWLRLKDEETPRPVAQWDLVLIPPGGGHVLTDTPDTTPVPLGSLVKPREEGGHHELLRFGGGGHMTRLVCGSFRLGPPAGHPLLALMPPAVVVRGSAGKPPAWLAPVLDFLGDEARSNQPGAETVISGLTEALLVQAVRAWMDTQPERASGWLGALRDPQVGRSLALVHSDPARAWTVATLASAVGMSRSPFSARFTALLGEAPLSYLRRWRLRLAAELLAQERLSVAEVAARVGYGSESALSRAFRREWGISPTDYRRRSAVA